MLDRKLKKKLSADVRPSLVFAIHAYITEQNVVDKILQKPYKHYKVISTDSYVHDLW